MIKRELKELNGVLIQLANFGNTKFKYAVLKNIEALKSSISVLVSIESDIKKNLDQFEKDRNELILATGVKKEDGTVYIDTNDKEAYEAFNIAIKELAEVHKEDLGIYNTRMNEYQDILNEDIDELSGLKKLSIDQLPESGITLEQLEILEKFNLINE